MNAKIAILTFSALVGVCLGTTVFAQAASQQAVDFQKIGENLTTTMDKCPERIWPNYNWKSVNVLMASDGQAPVLWRGQSGEISPLSAAHIPVGAFDGMYSFPKFEGNDAVALYLSANDLKNFGDRSTKQAFQTIVHEGFHLFGQRGWFTSSSIQRGTSYPISSVPRLYRRMMFDRMKEYFTSAGKSATSLAKAAYWNNKWRAEFPVEHINSMDRIEGTARYVEFLSPVIAQGGCQMSESDAYVAITNTLNSEMGYSVAGTRLQLDSEAYDLGTLAAFILRFTAKDSTWTMRMAKGDSPLDLVFENVLAAEDVSPDNLKTQFQQLAVDQNKEISSWLDIDIALIKSPDSIRVVPSDGSFQSGSYSPKGFFLLSAMTGVTATPLAQGVEFHNHSWKLNVAADKVMFGNLQGPCSGREILAVPQSTVTISNGLIEVHGSGLDGAMAGTLKTDANGFKWFCEDIKAGVGQ